MSDLLLWTRNADGSHHSNTGGYIVTKTPGNRFVLKVGDTIKAKGSLTSCKQMAEALHVANREAEAHRLADDGCPHHDEPPDEEQEPEEEPEDKSPPCSVCGRIRFGQVCPTHGRKLMGGIGHRMVVSFA